MKEKIIKCCICNKQIKDYKPTRLYRFEYAAGNYNQYSAVEHWNFCKKCYNIFDKWIQKYNEKEGI